MPPKETAPEIVTKSPSIAPCDASVTVTVGELITEDHFGWDIKAHNIVLENNGDKDTIAKWDSDAVGIAQPTQEELDKL